ncbi:serine/threonine-protein phosphatase 7 long form-like protein [Senna tora]|uniref:Serine/threonine-protein phosphatase 7 long form-like protein n=1 Tax=Senna tora TaxID=362788 RepID=A0A834WMV3_9FABA|nr:serine/threonine-protein phosphatase 7 long form-like protein [Senna tora]
MATSQRHRMLKLGQEDPSLLTLQSRHVSEAVWHGYIVWRSYHTLVIAQDYNQNSDIWRAQVPLICFHILEWHHPDRVMRQFGFDHPIPKALVDLGAAHMIKLSGKTTVNWSERQRDYAALFADWFSRICIGIGSSRLLRRHSEYMQWYSRHTRRWIDPASTTSGQAHIAPSIVRWGPPPVDWFKLNTDGTIYGNPSIAGSGGILRDHKGDWSGGFASYIGSCSALDAEGEALGQA